MKKIRKIKKWLISILSLFECIIVMFSLITFFVVIGDDYAVWLNSIITNELTWFILMGLSNAFASIIVTVIVIRMVCRVGKKFDKWYEKYGGLINDVDDENERINEIC